MPPLRDSQRNASKVGLDGLPLLRVANPLQPASASARCRAGSARFPATAYALVSAS